MRTDTAAMTAYQEAYERSLRDPAAFWAEAARGIDWYRPWTRVLDDSKRPYYRWFSGGVLNTGYNALDRHVAAGRDGGRPRRPSGAGTR